MNDWYRYGAALLGLTGLALVATAQLPSATDTLAAAPGDAVVAPDTTGAAIWSHLQESDYQSEWRVWPDKGRMYEGQQPHGAQLTTYLNDVAYQALMSEAGTFPDGAIVVKENYMPDGSLAAVTTMYKSDGYNAQHADWFFSKHLADGSLDTAPNGMELEGRLPGCQSCHMSKADNDYIFTGELDR